jgi:guanylate kinase
MGIVAEGRGLLVKRRGALVVVSAPSGAGKTTLCHEVRPLVPSLFYSVSCTTRSPRPGEVNGVDFHFTTEAEFVAMRERDEFAEWAVVHGHLYGTPARPLEAALARGEDVLLDIDTQGARHLRQRYPEAVTVFIMAPSLADLEARLRERRSDAAGEIARRLVRAREEMTTWREYDYLIINRDVKEAVERLATIIQGERWRTSRLTIKFPDLEVPQ